MRGWAKELAGAGIRVNAVSPGVILTPFHERFTTPEQLQKMQATIPMGRAGMAEECAGTFVYLASDALSCYVTGQVIEVNRGQYMPKPSAAAARCLQPMRHNGPASRGWIKCTAAARTSSSSSPTSSGTTRSPRTASRTWRRRCWTAWPPRARRFRAAT
jgi:hypothetical protein